MITSIGFYVVSLCGAVAVGSLIQAWGFWNWLKKLTPWGKSA